MLLTTFGNAILSSTDGYEGTIMLTASHMPWNANGLKFFTAVGGFEKSDVTSMLQKACEVRSGPGGGEGLDVYSHGLEHAVKACKVC